MSSISYSREGKTVAISVTIANGAILTFRRESGSEGDAAAVVLAVDQVVREDRQQLTVDRLRTKVAELERRNRTLRSQLTRAKNRARASEQGGEG